MQHESSHSSPGFGKNTNGFGIVIIAVVLVSFALVAWALWNDGGTEKSWYRLDEKATAAKAEGHGEHEPAKKVETHATVDSTDAPTIHGDSDDIEMPNADTSAKH
jgi:hypothetical protein